jgi:hypothetical protein
VVVVRVVDRLDGRGEDLVHATTHVRAGPAGDDGELADQLEVALAAVTLEGVFAGRDSGEGMGTGATGARMTAHVAAPSAVAVSARRRGVGGTARGSGEEPLQVTQSVAAVATRVDAVIAETAGVAPGTNRVRMNAEKPCGLRDGEGCVGGSR